MPKATFEFSVKIKNFCPYRKLNLGSSSQHSLNFYIRIKTTPKFCSIIIICFYLTHKFTIAAQTKRLYQVLREPRKFQNPSLILFSWIQKRSIVSVAIKTTTKSTFWLSGEKLHSNYITQKTMASAYVRVTVSAYVLVTVSRRRLLFHI